MGKHSSSSSKSSSSESRSRSRRKKSVKRRREDSDSPGHKRRGGYSYRRGGRFGKRGDSSDSNEQVREQRKKQERLAKVRALAYDENREADQVKQHKFQQAAAAKIAMMRSAGSKQNQVISASDSSGIMREGQNAANPLNENRYGPLDTQNGEATEQIQEKTESYAARIGLVDELEEGNANGGSCILTEEEIRQAKLNLKREWKRKKPIEEEDYVQTDSGSEDVADVFKSSVQPQPKASEQIGKSKDSSRRINPMTLSFSLPTEEDQEELTLEQQRIKEAADKGEDPFEAYMKNIESKAVKQESFGMLHHLKKHLPQETAMEEEFISQDLVATIDDIPQATTADGYMDEEANEDVEEGEFIQALKDIDKLKEVCEDKLGEDEDRQSALLSKSGSAAFDDDEEDDDSEPTLDYFTKKEKLADKKNLRPVNHSLVEYEPFRKSLYIECEDITAMSEADIEYFRKELGDIKLRGIECPRPIRNWYQCGLSDKILRTLLDKLKFEHPFAIQCQGIPVIMSGRDCIGIAETGSGKTLAFVLPMLRHIMDQRPLADSDGPIALIMVPTRELAAQVYNDTKVFCRSLGYNAACIYGGAGVAGQLSELKRGCEIVICTPGRMIDVLTTSNGKITNLRRVTYVVLDEADRMFDMGFEPQISRILANIRPDRQTVMFSATFPKNVETLAKKILAKPVEIVVGNRGQVGRNILQIIEVVEPDKKKVKLLEILGYWSSKGQILIFVDKQIEADNLFTELIGFGYSPLVLHGGQDQVDRQFTINDFKRGTKTLMIATSLCARGLDIKNLVLVINYSCPTHKEDYTHRIGRTGRAGNKGTAITFITPEEDKYAGDIIQALQIGNVDPPTDLLRLHERFMVKVRRGDAKEIRNRNMVGSGYRFTAEEMTKMIEFKNTMKEQFGVDLGDDNMSTTSRMSSMTSVKGSDDDKKSTKDTKDPNKIFKDSKTKDAIRKAATKAATQAIIAGATSEEVLLAAQNAIKEILMRLKEGEVISKDTSLDDLYRARDEMLEKDSTASGCFTHNFEINGYPESVRKRVSERDYLDMVANLTQCKLTVRGVFIEPGRKAMIGQKKIHVHIESEEKFNLHSAAEEIRKFCEENAMSSLSSAGGYTGYVGRY